MNKFQLAQCDLQNAVIYNSIRLPMTSEKSLYGIKHMALKTDKSEGIYPNLALYITLSEKNSSNKIVELSAWCRKFCPTKTFVRRKFLQMCN